MRSVSFFLKQLRTVAGRTLYWNVLGMIMVSLLEGIGIILLIPMLGMGGIAGIDAASTPLSEWLAPLGHLPAAWRLPTVLGLFVAIVLAQTLLKQRVSLQNARMNHKFEFRLRSDTYRGILQAKWEYFIRTRKSDLINALTGELARVNGGIALSLQLLASVIFTVIQVCLALWLSPLITLLVLLCGAALAFFMRRSLRKAKSLGSRSTDLARQYLAGISDQLNGIREIKTNALERSRLSWLESISAKIHEEQYAFLKLRNKSQSAYQAASAVLIALFLFVFVHLLDTSLEQLILVVLIFSRLWPRFTGIQSNLEQISSYLPSFRSILTIQSDCRAAAEAIFDKEERNAGLVVRQSLDCRGVYYRYDAGGPNYALRNVNLSIPACGMTAVVGRSGAGKSTLIDLVMGLSVPERGQILIDGVPLSGERLHALRQSIGYVPQDPFLFNDTIRNNLTMVKPSASEEELWECLAFSASADFVRRLPQGLDTYIGDRGVRLSGGERQRLVLARAILRKPAILILDEATSALDSENESKIQEALEKLRGRMTLVVIAHRLSTIRGADQVVVLDQGTVVQCGSFAELAAEKRGLFGSLLDNQTLAASG
ncbi:ABC transporter ATP-binding protein [Cohnella sp. JJ-181]|uniref:ABC transporter ATP-binding protein n=1 Tax=Cohnella rhizoplanae TaxID=2974897 RepID=UPI0022FF8A61|nr:ABC transporter ATP-binding protein [Cohnella sp. JJ-181]CAI6036561.1 Heterocyst differentiation ATP-binding protein HepA [Cohnella sp. JJ-181]